MTLDSKNASKKQNNFRDHKEWRENKLENIRKETCFSL